MSPYLQDLKQMLWKFDKEPIFKRKVSSNQPSGGQSASQPIGIKDPVPDQNVRN